MRVLNVFMGLVGERFIVFVIRGGAKGVGCCVCDLRGVGK